MFQFEILQNLKDFKFKILKFFQYSMRFKLKIGQQLRFLFLNVKFFIIFAFLIILIYI